MAQRLPPAYCFFQEFEPTLPRVASFGRDYLIYATSGSIRISFGQREWVLPPSFGAWVPANTEIGIDIPHAMTCCSVLFEPGYVRDLPGAPVVFTMPRHAREMITFSRRWPAETAEFDAHADAVFRAIAETCKAAADDPSDIWAPAPRSPEIERALIFLKAELATEVTLTQTAAVAGLSERTLSRKFQDELAMSWAQCLRQLRMIRAVECLSHADKQVTATALDCGYASLSAFNKAFLTFTGLTPSAFRARSAEGSLHPNRKD